MEIVKDRGCDNTGARTVCVSAQLWIGNLDGCDVVALSDEWVLSRAPLGLDGC